MEAYLDIDQLLPIVDKFVKAYCDGIKKADAIATGALYLETEGYIKVNDNDHVRVILSVPEEWKYVEYGRKAGGKFPPLDAIKQWIRIKGLPRSNYGIKGAKHPGKLPTEDLLAFLIGRKIARDGIEPRPVLQNTLDKFQLEKKLINAIAENMIKRFVEEALK